MKCKPAALAVVLLAAALSAAGPGRAQAPQLPATITGSLVFVPVGGEVLEWRAFDPKAPPFYQELTTETKQRMTVMGQEVLQTQEQTFLIKWEPKEMKDGRYVVSQKVVGVKFTINIGGNTISYDSTGPMKAKNPMTDFFDQLLKQELTFTIDPKTMEVKDVTGQKESVKNLGDTNPQMKPLLGTLLSPDALKRMVEPAWWALPPGPVRKGGTWTKRSEFSLGPIGTYDTTLTFSYEGENTGGLERIKIKTDTTYTAPAANQQAGLPFAIKAANLKSKGGSGETLFDRDKGRFVSSTVNMKLAGSLTIEVGNMPTDITIDQDQKSTTRTFDSHPWEK